MDGMQEKGEWGGEETVDEGSFDEGVCHFGFGRFVVLFWMVCVGLGTMRSALVSGHLARLSIKGELLKRVTLDVVSVMHSK